MHKGVSILLLGLVILLLVSCARKEWPPAGAAEARAFLYNLDGRSSQGLVIGDSLNSTVVNNPGVTLTPEQISRLTHALTDPLPAQPQPDCLPQPRHGVVFYDSQHKPIAWAELCFECRLYRLSSGETRKPVNWDALKALFLELGLPVLNLPDDYKALQKTNHQRELDSGRK